MKLDPQYFNHLSLHQNIVCDAWSYNLLKLDESECLVFYDYHKNISKYPGKFLYEEFLELFFQDHDLIYKEKYYTYTPNQNEIILKKVLYDDKIWKYLVTKK